MWSAKNGLILIETVKKRLMKKGCRKFEEVLNGGTIIAQTEFTTKACFVIECQGVKVELFYGPCQATKTVQLEEKIPQI
jgi:hypothetical protein